MIDDFQIKRTFFESKSLIKVSSVVLFVRNRAAVTGFFAQVYL